MRAQKVTDAHVDSSLIASRYGIKERLGKRGKAWFIVLMTPRSINDEHSSVPQTRYAFKTQLRIAPNSGALSVTS